MRMVLVYMYLSGRYPDGLGPMIAITQPETTNCKVQYVRQPIRGVVTTVESKY